MGELRGIFLPAGVEPPVWQRARFRFGTPTGHIFASEQERGIQWLSLNGIARLKLDLEGAEPMAFMV
jgi:hypothetical protein